jgi:CheY-like chemotaxis protein
MVSVQESADGMESIITVSFHSDSPENYHHGEANSYSDSSSRDDHPLTLGVRKTIEGGGSIESTKQILLIDDDADSCFTIKANLESYFKKDLGASEATLQITTFSDPIEALRQFKPYYYDLLLVDVNMPGVDGYELVEKIVKLDLNIKVCFMSAGEVNDEALREIRHPSRSIGCFIEKPASRDDLVGRVLQELD